MAHENKFYIRFKPHILMVLAQIGYTFLYFITDASFDHGMNPHVYITYRHIVSGVVMLPFAYFLERETRTKLTVKLFLEIFVLSLLGVSVTQNMYFASLRYTSPTFLAAVINTIASLTFIIAVVLRMEVVDLQNPRGIAKVLGTCVSLSGVTTMTLYKGPAIKNPWHPLLQFQGSSIVHKDWVKGSILTITSCITWSIWFIMQAFTLKRYPAALSLTTWLSFVGAAQSAVFTVIIEHKTAAWTIGFNIDFWSTLYGGVVVSGLIVFIQLWCTKQIGPVFVTMFNPLSTILVAVIAYFILGQKLYVGRYVTPLILKCHVETIRKEGALNESTFGKFLTHLDFGLWISIIGGSVVIVGLYLLLWGKDHNQEIELQKHQQPYDQGTDHNKQMTDAAPSETSNGEP